MVLATDLGPFRELVAVALAAVAAATSLTLCWKGSLGWQPYEQVLPQAAERAGGVAGATGIVLLSILGRESHARFLVGGLAVGLAVAFVVLFLAHSYLVTARTYAMPADRGGMRLVGGFHLTPAARDAMAKHRVPSIEQLLRGVDYRADVVWTKGSRDALAIALTTTYLGLVIAGTLTLACVGVLGTTAL